MSRRYWELAEINVSGQFGRRDNLDSLRPGIIADVPSVKSFRRGNCRRFNFVLFFQFIEYLPGDEDISIISEPNVGCLGDVVPNGSIDISDILLILSQYGCLSNCDTDVTGDGAVTIADVLAVLSVFGEICP